jgi:SAM-dependent methyltransferase
MKKNIRHNLNDSNEVDQINKKFYERFSYPWKPSAIQTYRDPMLWVTMINQDLGHFANHRIPKESKIWVAGCGTNQAIFTALKFPYSSVIGTDISRNSLKACQGLIDELGITNLTLKEQTLNQPIFEEEFDYIICTGVIHHNAIPQIPLRNLSRALRKNGVLELMVYNSYHRILTTAYQKAIRILCSRGEKIDIDLEMPITKIILDHFPLQNLMGKFLSSIKLNPEPAVADALLQPIEYSYTVESLDELVRKENLEILHPCVNQFDKQKGTYTWDINFNDQAVTQLYYALSDIERWQVSNLLMLESSPMLWFYLHRLDSKISRKSEKEACNEFLDTIFEPVRTSFGSYILGSNGTYKLSSNDFSFPPTPTDPLIKKIVEAIDSKKPMKTILKKLKIETSFHMTNKIRINLTSSGFPYLRTHYQTTR